jgi:hypothetical protein
MLINKGVEVKVYRKVIISQCYPWYNNNDIRYCTGFFASILLFQKKKHNIS